jgi:octaheme c-type cytochrome (tetrathionate reductase family)
MENIDCLVCHDTTGTYGKKKRNNCGYPNESVDLLKVAQNVGMPTRSNCGGCHWYGGGGDNVKHGDMSSVLADPPRQVDVHMGELGFTCQKCHTTKAHKIAGRSTTSAVSEGTVACRDCHEKKPHDSSSQLLSQLNAHCDAIACQSCHIPKYARKVKTVVLWDWSQSGEGNQMLKQTDKRVKQLSKKKGLLIKEKNLRPRYEWYNGKHRRYLKGDPVDMDGVTELNPPDGDIYDPQARIWPYKLMKGIEPADLKNGYLIVPKLHGEGGYFNDFDWHEAAKHGMKAAGLDFSGRIRFVETRMHWRLNHEVAPANEALSCLDCHHPDGVMDFEALGYEGDPAVTGGRDTAEP